MKHPAITLIGRAASCRAVLNALAAIPPVFLPLTWRLHGGGSRCEIREAGRTTVGWTWESTVRAHLAPPAPLKSIRVKAPSGGLL